MTVAVNEEAQRLGAHETIIRQLSGRELHVH